MSDPKAKWHKWFAWYPVEVTEGDIRWFSKVWRRAADSSYDGYGGYIWSYLPPEISWEVEEIKSQLRGDRTLTYGRFCFEQSNKVLLYRTMMLVPSMGVLVFLIYLIGCMLALLLE